MNAKVNKILSAAACAAIALPFGLQGQSLSTLRASNASLLSGYSSSSDTGNSADGNPFTPVSALLSNASSGASLPAVAASV